MAAKTPLFVYEGWYSITKVRGAPSFWAAWWTGEPCSSPWRTPDATGTGNQPEAVLAAEAQRRIRAVKGQGAFVREVDASWASAARREANGKAPRHQPPPPPRKPRSELERPARKSARRQAEESERQRAEAAWWAEWRARLQREMEAALREATEAAARQVADALRQSAGAPVAAFTLLGLPTTATPEDIGKAYRRKVAMDRIHPDQGGDVATFRAVTEARDRALAYAGGSLSPN